MNNKSHYTLAGVNIDKANEFISNIKPLVSSTFKRGVLTEIGGFAGLFAIDTARYQSPVLVSSTDGVGTKLKIAFMSDIHDTIGIDLVAMCINDIIVCGAQPLFFLDYFATGKLAPDVAISVIKGIVEGCKIAGCSLIGGETAEMPGFYADNEYDLAGFAVGVVERDKIIDGSEISVDNILVGLSSSGLHSNGFSLVRKICFDDLGLSISDNIPELGNRPLGELLLTPTRIYSTTIAHLLKQHKINGMVHMTGGGFQDNIPRILPNSCKAVINIGSWPVPPIFSFLEKKGGIETEEMMHIFNYGIGMILIVPEAEAQDVVFQSQVVGEKAFIIGRVETKAAGEQPVVFKY
ncbi:MAG: phosphoribosylformylglycinamidine cyclo-ligase [Dissulfurimicrobium hydrothermale]|uniref:phosphoribosylformylglycinamidine cyclo-ligase n=1 Tax=Dissulfurimicrobium hydrothermale TaxID=1750598 RepID=UPI003C78C62B